MPELPEVEVLARSLRPRLVGRRIERVAILRDKLIAAPTPRAFAARLRGRTITALNRRGKTLWVELDDGGHWLTHLRMTGWWHHHGARNPGARDPHVLARFALDEGALLYRDPRRFGRMWWTRDPESHFAGLGPEPLEPAFRLPAFRAALARRAAPIKQALLDPKLVAGIGNIYASESCHVARLDPRRPARALAADEARALRVAIRKVLRRAIRLGATVEGVYHDKEFRVYGREGEPCRRCRAPILKTVLGQRSTYFCPACQVS